MPWRVHAPADGTADGTAIADGPADLHYISTAIDERRLPKLCHREPHTPLPPLQPQLWRRQGTGARVGGAPLDEAQPVGGRAWLNGSPNPKWKRLPMWRRGFPSSYIDPTPNPTNPIRNSPKRPHPKPLTIAGGDFLRVEFLKKIPVSQIPPVAYSGCMMA